MSLGCDHAACFLLTPKGANRTDIDCLFLFEQQEIEKPDFDPSDTVDFWDLVNRQDRSACERVQRAWPTGSIISDTMRRWRTGASIFATMSAAASAKGQRGQQYPEDDQACRGIA